MELILSQSNWEALIRKLRIRYPQLTEADLEYEEGREDGMLRMVEYKLRKTKNEMLKIIADIGFTLSKN
jgi:hypothetical protein